MRRLLDLLRRALAAPFLLVVRGYRRFISPFTPPTCRFTPTCSAYAEEALRTLSLPRALLLITWRLLRCQPMCRGGYDPVPSRSDADPAADPAAGRSDGPSPGPDRQRPE